MITFPIELPPDLQVHLLTPQDATAQYQLLHNNRAFIGQWEAWARTTDVLSQERFIADCQRRYLNGEGFAVGIWLQPVPELAGVISGLITPDGSAELGYWLGQEYTGRGIMTRAMQAVCDALLAEETIYELLLIIADGNQASIHVAERLGFQRVQSSTSFTLDREHFIRRSSYILRKQTCLNDE